MHVADSISNVLRMKQCHLLQRFRPMSLEKPKVLLPLVGVPMISYTLEWLASNKMSKASTLSPQYNGDTISLPHLRPRPGTDD